MEQSTRGTTSQQGPTQEIPGVILPSDKTNKVRRWVLLHGVKTGGSTSQLQIYQDKTVGFTSRPQATTGGILPGIMERPLVLLLGIKVNKLRPGVVLPGIKVNKL